MTNASYPISIVGVGAVSPFGFGVDRLWDGLLRGVPERSDVPEFARQGLTHPAAFWFRGDLVAADRARRFSMAAADQALAQARVLGLGFPVDTSRCGVFIATSHDEPSNLSSVSDAIAGGMTPTSAALSGVLRSSLPDSICEGIGWDRAYRELVTSACAGTNVALALACDLIGLGAIDLALVVGVDTLSRITQAGFSILGALDGLGPRPFDSSRHGTLPGEGAAAFVLMGPRGGVQELARVVGHGESCDALHPVQSDAAGVGIQSAIEAALKGHETAVHVVYAHGTGTAQNDIAEAAALERVFAARGLGEPVVTAIKSVIGHAMGAAPGLSAVAGIMSLRTGMVPAIAGLASLDERCRVRVVTGEPVELPVCRTVLNCGYGFGGINSAIALGLAEQ